MLTMLNKFGDKLHWKSTLRPSSRGKASSNMNNLAVDVSLNERDVAIPKPPTGGPRGEKKAEPAMVPRDNTPKHSVVNYQQAKEDFLVQFPQYRQTKVLDSVREKEFARLKQGDGTVYMDYMGGCLYPDTLVKRHMEQLTSQVLGNTHSDSPSSKQSEASMSAARAAVLSYFSASPEDYVCIFTPNCTGALKIVGESFPFRSSAPSGSGSRFILAEDSHNSVNGIRAFAEKAGAEVKYAKGIRKGGFEEAEMMAILRESPPQAGTESLVAITGQSNISGFRPNLLPVLSEAKRLGYSTLVDAAALASTCQIVVSKSSPSTSAASNAVAHAEHASPTHSSTPFTFHRPYSSRPSSSSGSFSPFASSRLSLHANASAANPNPNPNPKSNSPSPAPRGTVINLEDQADAIAISFYKMFGYPTGVGALIIKKSFLAKLKKPWFSGGTVEIVGIPHGVTESSVNYERFEEGTINYASLSAVTNGLQWLAKYTHSPVLSTRLSALHAWLHHSLEGLRHGNGTQVVRIHTRDPLESRCSKEGADSSESKVGYIVSCTFHRPDGTQMPISQVSSRASQNRPAISLRTGCVCNPGGGIALLGVRDRFGPRIQRWMCGENESKDGAACALPAKDMEDHVRLLDLKHDLGTELGVVRLSLGIVTDFKDVWEVLKFATTFVES